MHRLVNAAGVIRLVWLDAVTEDDWDSTMAVNARALFFLCQAFVPRLPEGGAVANIASVAGNTGLTHEAAAYGASKATVLSVRGASLHAYATSGVRVNAVCSGLIDMPMKRRCDRGSLAIARTRAGAARTQPPRGCVRSVGSPIPARSPW